MKKIDVPILARVEGEGSLHLEIANDAIQQLQLKIYEPPRLFEKFLESRNYDEVVDFVARICGICPVAYQMSAVQALEQIFNITPTPWIYAMRRLFYCGEWIESHAMHIHFLAAPDFLGYDSALEFAKDYPDLLKRGIRLQYLGNDLIKLLGARSVHPVGACVGGFFHAPSVEQMREMLTRIENCLHDAEELVYWTASFQFSQDSQNIIAVSLRHPHEYPMNEGEIVSSIGHVIPKEEFDRYFKENQVPYSNALHCLLEGKHYLVGPLARINLNKDRLPEEVLVCMQKLPMQFPSQNIAHSVVARALEIYFSLIEARRILQNYVKPKQSRVEVFPKSGIGFGCTEAPRGLLWHRYELNADGLVKSCRIVPPTSQNQGQIESNLKASLTAFGLKRDVDELRHYAETIIRHYDPCISCATHFLKLSVTT